jgi:aspartyl-tRNA(Asn)/glutamyl-tRNA(Gln) amidotransferase subunit A
VKVFEDLGAKVEEKNPGFEDPAPLFMTHWFAGAAFLLKGIPKEKHELIDPGLREMAAQGEKVSAHDFLDAQLKRGALGAHMNLFHRDYDLLLTPTLSIPAFDAGKEVADKMLQSRWTDWTPFTFPFNLTQQPAASIACGLTAAGLPVGLHLVGPKYADARVLRAARAFETVRPIRTPNL